MKIAKRWIFVLAAVFTLISGAVTVCAVSAEQGQAASAPRQELVTEYTAEEMAVGDYYTEALL